MSATVDKSTRPDTSNMYEMVWYTASGLPLECFFNYNPPDPDDEIIPSAPARDPGMSLRYAFVCGTHDISDMLTVHISEQIEHDALLDYFKKDRAEREKKFGPFFGPSIDYTRHFSSACFLG